MVRTVPEWIGKTDDAKVPPRVRQRVVPLSIPRLTSQETGRGVHISDLRRAELRAEAARLAILGYKQFEIAEAIGATRSRLNRWCRAEILGKNGPLRLLSFSERTLPQMMWDRVECRGPDECWPWTGTIKNNGYGSLNFKGRCFQAHRVVFETLRGEIPAGLEIDHICNARNCVNPKHLQLVSHAENMALMKRRRA